MPNLSYSVEFDCSLNDGERQLLAKMISKQGGVVTLGDYDETKGVEVVVIRYLNRLSILKIANQIASEKLHGVYLI